jgi:hypothetical protein
VKKELIIAYLTSDGTVERDKRCSITFAEQYRIPTPTELTCQLLLPKQRSLRPPNDTTLTSADRADHREARNGSRTQILVGLSEVSGYLSTNVWSMVRQYIANRDDGLNPATEVKICETIILGGAVRAR